MSVKLHGYRSWGLCSLIATAVTLVASPAWARIPQVVPEPTTLSLLGGGVVGVIALYRMRRGK